MQMILFIQFIFRRPMSARRNTAVCTNSVCQSCEMRQMWAGSGQMYSFSSEGTAYWVWLQGMVALNPNSALMGGRGWERYVWNWMRGEWGERLSEADVTPISSLCLNKSCSRSFYLHMLTGTSEFPEERCRGKRWREKKTEEEKPGRAVSKSLSGPFSSCDVILIKPYSTNSHFLIHTCTKVQKGVENKN